MTAIFWHVVVYRTRGGGQSRRAEFLNVRDSAEMFRSYMRMNSADANAVQELIMATPIILRPRPAGNVIWFITGSRPARRSRPQPSRDTMGAVRVQH
jgi:hypothetical protein